MLANILDILPIFLAGIEGPFFKFYPKLILFILLGAYVSFNIIYSSIADFFSLSFNAKFYYLLNCYLAFCIFFSCYYTYLSYF